MSKLLLISVSLLKLNFTCCALNSVGLNGILLAPTPCVMQGVLKYFESSGSESVIVNYIMTELDVQSTCTMYF